MTEKKMTQEMNHEEIDPLLPWYVNGTISEEDRHRVEEHLSECADCQREVLFLKKLEEAVETEPSPVPSPGLLQDTLERIGRRRLNLFDRVTEWLAPAPRLRWAAIATGLAIVLQTTVIVGLLGRSGEKTYETLTVTSTQQETGPRIVIAFQENVTEAVMRETLHTIRGQIVSGPSPLGFYIIELPKEESLTIDKRLEELRAKKEVIRFAERAQ